MAEFLHGVETTQAIAGPKAITEVKTAIIGLVGTFPVHHVTGAVADDTALAVTLDPTGDAAFGPDVSGYSIPNALAAIRGEEGSTVVVVNLFDPATHKTDVAEATLTVVGGKIQLGHADVIAATVKTTADAACVEGTDYTIDRVQGLITIKAGGALAAATQAKVAYSYGDPSAVDADAIIGTVDAGGQRSGAQALLGAMAQLGYAPKILIAPGYSSDPTVEQALNAIAAKLRGIVLADAPLGATLTDVLAARLTADDISLVTQDTRTFYCFPYQKVAVPGGGTALEPFSPALAGAIAATDRAKGYWHSPSNRQLRRAIGLELPLSASLNDPDCDVNRLNAAGIVTIFSGGTAGRRAWGNRSSAFPGSTLVDTFMPVLRTLDAVTEAVEYYTLERATDEPVTQVLIDAVLEDISAYIRSLVSQGALITGSKVECLPEKNPPAQLATGKIVFTRTLMPPVPAEHVVHEQIVDVNLLANVFGS